MLFCGGQQCLSDLFLRIHPGRIQILAFRGTFQPRLTVALLGGNFHVVTMELTLAVAENGATRKYYVKVAQGYVEQGTTWKIAAEQRARETRLKGPAERKDLYPAGVDAQKEIAQALLTAAKEHKRVLLVFGGNWCYDCH